MLFIDLDNFKQINDRRGHAAGDAVLVELGRRLQAAIRPTDTVARFGGDEFVVVCEQINEQSAFALAHRLQRAIQVALKIGEIEYELTASIGLAVGRADPRVLIERADVALYRAKALGLGHVEFFG